MRKILRAPTITDPQVILSINSGHFPTEMKLNFPHKMFLKPGDVLFFEDTPYYILNKPQWKRNIAYVKLAKYPDETPLEFDMFYFRAWEFIRGTNGEKSIKKTRKDNCFTSRYDHGKFTYSPWLNYYRYYEEFGEYTLERGLIDCVLDYNALLKSLNLSSPKTYEDFFGRVTVPKLMGLDILNEDIAPDIVHKRLGKNTVAIFKYNVTAEENDDQYEVYVTWQMLREWGVTIDELYQRSIKNIGEYLPQYCEAKALSWDYSDNDETPQFAKIQCQNQEQAGNIAIGAFTKEIQDIVEASGLVEKGEGWYCAPIVEGDIYIFAKKLVDSYEDDEKFMREFSKYLETHEEDDAKDVSLELFEYVWNHSLGEGSKKLVSRGVLSGEDVL